MFLPTIATGSRQPLQEGVAIRCNVTDSFAGWMAQSAGALAISTYQASKVALLGWTGRQVNVLMRHFEKPMGMAIENSQIALACRHEVWMFANAPLLAHDYDVSQRGRYDSLYLPRVKYFTGDLNTHDLAFGSDGLWLVNTRFSCLSLLSDQYSFLPQWQPSFITQLAPEDRCHLNGLAMRDGRPRYVTALGTTDEPGAWRESKATGGVLMDVTVGRHYIAGPFNAALAPLAQRSTLVAQFGHGRTLACRPRARRTHRRVRPARLPARPLFRQPLRADWLEQDPRKTHLWRTALAGAS